MHQLVAAFAGWRAEAARVLWAISCILRVTAKRNYVCLATCVCYWCVHGGCSAITPENTVETARPCSSYLAGIALVFNRYKQQQDEMAALQQLLTQTQIEGCCCQQSKHIAGSSDPSAEDTEADSTGRRIAAQQEANKEAQHQLDAGANNRACCISACTSATRHRCCPPRGEAAAEAQRQVEEQRASRSEAATSSYIDTLAVNSRESGQIERLPSTLGINTENGDGVNLSTVSFGPVLGGLSFDFHGSSTLSSESDDDLRRTERLVKELMMQAHADEQARQIAIAVGVI